MNKSKENKKNTPVKPSKYTEKQIELKFIARVILVLVAAMILITGMMYVYFELTLN